MSRRLKADDKRLKEDSCAESLNDKASSHHEKEGHNVVENEKPSFLTRLCYHMAFMKYVILLLFFPPFLNYAAQFKEASALFPPGELVTLGWGQKTFINCLGNGLPTVILESPTGMNSDVWHVIQQKLSKFAKVCIYDRSGLGYSTLPFNEMTTDDIKYQSGRFVAQPFTIEQMVSDLHHLVSHARPLPRPFILVGSEIGALVTRLYALLYNKDVSGLMLIDPLVENLFSNIEWTDYWYSYLVPSFQSLHLSAILGLSRIAIGVGWLQPAIVGDDLEPSVVLRQKYLMCNPTHISTVFNEHFYANVSISQMRNALEVNKISQDIPISVIYSNYSSRFPGYLKQVWNVSQQYFLQELHPACNYISTDNDYHTLYTQPKVIIDEVYKLINKWKKGRS